ncbi:LPS-assembly protein LptD [Aliiroseovarius crassostreae]|uniref:LPS-assembly protein LptD n=1 Tax=Aliiroseovarius crassostreae TaxID=154981 RepID=UPI0021AFD8D8|nr:LPS assembly protein LptD [Aliiroseovarius crassostreae]UWQ06154.1 LPS assembly protein LptD [Aliiroseovarius crassostreae]
MFTISDLWSGRISKLALIAGLATAIGLATPPTTFAQSRPVADSSAPALLVADRITVQGNSGLLAEGNVMVHFAGTTLTAASISFDKTTDRLTISGPIVLQNGEDQLILASAAELSSDLRNGILQSARLVLNQQLQIAAVEINRVQGRYTQLNKIVASSCQVCAKSPVPLWQIRAEKVVHDEQERQLYFHNAQLRVADVPILFLPRLRLPDPTLKRATGFLAPKLRTRSSFGTGVRLPYFIRLGDHADLTLAPFIATRSRTLEWRYRQAFHNGNLSFNGAVSNDDIRRDQTRFYVFGEGSFDLPQDFKLDFTLQEVSDPGYLNDYDYSSADRLRNALEVSRVRRDEFIFAGITRHESLRASERAISDQLPFAQLEFLYQRRFDPVLLGGVAEYELSARSYFRESTLDGPKGRDVTHVGASFHWKRDWMLRGGMIASLETGIDWGNYWINQDSSFDPNQSFATPSVAATLRWPFSRVSANGNVDVIEPVLQLVWSDRIGATLPNEDSTYVEFDENNLFDMSRYPGFDRREEGTRANIGVKWSRFSPTGWASTIGIGRVFRFDGNNAFSNASGLSGDSSDWLIAAQLQFGANLALQGRALINDQFEVAKTESRFAYIQEDWNLSAAHLWVVADPDENRDASIHELRLTGGYQLTDGWRISAEGDVDLSANQVTKGQLGLQYRNECLQVDLAVSRRFTASQTITPTTELGLQVELLGFGGAPKGAARRCLQ